MAKRASRQASIFVNGQQVEATAKNISTAYRQASNELGRMVVGSDQYLDKLQEVGKLGGMLKQHRDNLRGVQQGWTLAKAGLGDFIGVAAGAFAVDSLIGYGKQLFNIGTQMELMEKKAKTVFGDAFPKITAEADKNARAMGVTNAQYIAMAANIQDLLVPMGFQRQEAAGISAQLTNLSGALAEWSGGQRTAKEVSDILSAALVGERDALKGLGIDLQQADIDAELLARGLNTLTGESRKQAEAAVTLDLILRKSADAQAQYAEGAGTMARRQAELSAKISEIQEKIATLLIPVFEGLLAIAGPVVDVIGDIVGGINDMIHPAEAATRAFEQQAQEVAGLEKDLVPLLDRYDVLKTKTTLTADEQEELKQIIEKVGGAIPTAITQFGKYGEALDINTAKAREFIETEQARLRVTNEKAISEFEKYASEAQKRLEQIQKQLQEGSKFQIGYGIGDRGREVKLTADEIRNLQAEAQRLADKVKGANAELDRLTGKGLDKALEPSTETPTTGTGPTPEEIKATEAAKKERERKAEADKRERERQEKELKDHLERIQGIVQKHEEEARLAALSDDERELERIRLRYQAEIDQVKSKFAGEQKVKDAVAELEKQRDAEIAKVEEQRRIEKVQEEIETYVEEQEEIEKAKREFEEGKAEAAEQLKEFQDEALFTERELELQALQAHYDELIKLAEKYGLDVTKLKEAFAKKQAKLEDDIAKEIAADQAQAFQARLAAMQEAFTTFGDIASATFDLLAKDSEESAALQKLLTLAKISFDTAAAISSLVAASNANPANAVTFGAAGVAQYVAGLARILANIAQAKKILSEAPEVKQKYEGSYLSVTGNADGRRYYAQAISAPPTGLLPGRPVLFNSTATGQPVLASERGAEYFVASKDLQNPYVANLVRMIDNITHGGTGVAQFQDGGANPAGSVPATAAAAPAIDPAMFQQFTQAINTLSAVLAAGIEATIPDRTITDLQKRFKVINDASGGFFS